MAEGSDTRKIYGVSELTAVIRGLLKPFDRIYVEGEISGWKVYASGHAYFTLKDAEAQISCVMFASAIGRCKAAARLRDGAKVCLYGRLEVYAARGSYQLVVLAAKIAGEGDLMAKFNELKERLGREGLFDPSRKRRLPFLPHRIAIVTSPSGAVIHDMCTVLTRRFPNVEVRLYPVKVQGPGAREEIVEGLEFFNRPSDWVPDLLIVGRGGGSIEDLWPFNEECVVRAVAASRIPTVSAVGHETDFTLCDFAADFRAGTPSMAAELAVPDKAKLVRQVDELSMRLRRAPQHMGETFAQRIDHLSLRLAAALRDAAIRTAGRIDVISRRLVPSISEALIRAESRIVQADQRLVSSMNAAVAAAGQRLSAEQAKLVLLDPSNPLKRGYSMTVDAAGRIVRSVRDVRSGAELVTRLADGEIRSVAR